MQLTIFDVVGSHFYIGDTVQTINVKSDMDAETYFYLQDLQGKQGKISKIIKYPTLQYEVDFDGHIAVVYHTEVKG